MTYGKAVDGKDPGPETNEKSLGPIYGSSSARQAPRVTRQASPVTSPSSPVSRSSRPSPTHPWRHDNPFTPSKGNFRPVAPVYTPESFFDESDFQRVFNRDLP